MSVSGLCLETPALLIKGTIFLPFFRYMVFHYPLYYAIGIVVLHKTEVGID